MNFGDFIRWEITSTDTIDFKKVYVDMAGDVISGLLLSQIVYWYLPDKNGKPKLRVKHDGEFWIAKRRADWWDEIRISTKQFDRASKVLEAKELIVTAVYKFAGRPTKHVRLNIAQFLSVFTQRVKSILPKGEGYVDLWGISLTENTTENTNLPDGGFVSKHKLSKLHKLYGGLLNYRVPGDPDYEDPRLYHPAMRVWRGFYNLDVTPAGNWRDRIIENVSDTADSLKIWRQSMEVWAGVSSNKNAPMRVLSIYKNGGVLDDLREYQKKQAEANRPEKNAGIDPLSTDRINERMENWARLKALREQEEQKEQTE